MEVYSMDIQCGDALVHCKVAGREGATAILFLHGNGEDLSIFEAQIEYFSPQYRTVTIDTRGHGQSTRGTAPLHFYTFANDLIAVLDALSIDKAHLVGFSDGAIIALHTALMAPERILSMVLLGVNYNTKGLRFIPRIEIALVYAWLSVASLFSKVKRKRKEIWGLMVLHPNLTIEELSKISIPALVVTGEKDMVRQHHNDELCRVITGAQRLIIPNGDHFWMFSNPHLFNQCVMEFLQVAAFACRLL